MVPDHSGCSINGNPEQDSPLNAHGQHHVLACYFPVFPLLLPAVPPILWFLVSGLPGYACEKTVSGQIDRQVSSHGCRSCGVL